MHRGRIVVCKEAFGWWLGGCPKVDLVAHALGTRASPGEKRPRLRLRRFPRLRGATGRKVRAVSFADFAGAIRVTRWPTSDCRRLTLSKSSVACDESSWAAPEVCSAPLALAWVILSIWLTDWLSWPMPWLCSWEAVAIALTSESTLRVLSTIWWRTCATSSEIVTPRSLFWMASSIFAAVSFAAVAEALGEGANLFGDHGKTSSASPARAASTAALSARMFVWNAISSMVLMILAMSWEEALISPMAVRICSMCSEPRSAELRFSAESVLAWWELSEFCLVVAAISSSDALVSSRLAACSLEPWASVSLAAATCVAALEIWVATSESVDEMPPSAPLTPRIMISPAAAQDEQAGAGECDLGGKRPCGNPRHVLGVGGSVARIPGNHRVEELAHREIGRFEGRHDEGGSLAEFAGAEEGHVLFADLDISIEASDQFGVVRAIFIGGDGLVVSLQLFVRMGEVAVRLVDQRGAGGGVLRFLRNQQGAVAIR